jgi:hypothetical protein
LLAGLNVLPSLIGLATENLLAKSTTGAEQTSPRGICSSEAATRR